MAHDENDFPPLSIDQQIEHPQEFLSRGSAHLVQDIQSFYAQEKNGSLERVWGRLSERRNAGKRYAVKTQEQPVRREEIWPQAGAGLAQPVQKKGRRTLALLAAVLVCVALVGSMALVFGLVRGGPGSTSTGSQQPTPTKVVSPTANSTPAVPSACIDPQDLADQALCAAHKETVLNLTKTFATPSGGTVRVTFLRAYADTGRFMLLYTENEPPTSDWISFLKPTLQSGLSLTGGSSHACNGTQTGAVPCQMVEFETNTIPAGTTELHIVSIVNGFTGTTVPLKFTVPFHTDSKTVPVHKAQTNNGYTYTLDHLVLTGSMAFFYSEMSPSNGANGPIITTLTVNGQSLNTSGGAVQGAQYFDLSLLDDPGSWTIKVVLIQPGQRSPLARWTISFTVPA